MKYSEYSNVLDRIIFLAERKMTGTPNELSQKLNVSPSTIKRMIRTLKDKNIPITYCRYENSYIIQ
ncbi:HTH domain-containing protein [Fulvivirga imtechensis]|uniref:HTH domain-containing protein n=1 Tax=Fulvivirga imtechensis TaxID=881893 RepID=UPI000A01FD0D|nr:HTH domain-containing protein [Fulvivirga imtechensis]